MEHFKGNSLVSNEFFYGHVKYKIPVNHEVQKADERTGEVKDRD